MDMQWLEAALSQAVRTPLHSFLGFLELFSMTDVDDDQRRLIDQLVASSEDLLAGSDRVLWLVRLQEGRYRAHQRTVDLPSFVAELVAASDGLSSVVAPGAPRQVQTDLAALHQLVAELVANATVHGADPVVLAVSPAGPASAEVRITVSDGGAGMPSAARRLLQGAVTGSAPAEGLGLLLVRRLAELLGGTVQMLPTHVGTTVALTLPVAAPAVPVPEEPVAVGSDLPARPLRVLLVEDNATNRLLAQRQLARLGHTLVAVPTGTDGVGAALDESPEGQVDVVLMDRHLPDIDGCEATARIRAELRPDRPYLPIIAVTADATPESRDACMAAGMDEVLTKPVDLQSLDAALRRAAAGTARTGSDAPGPARGVPAASHVPAGQRVPAALRAIVLCADGDPEAAAELVCTYLGELPGRRLRIQASLRRGEPRAVLAAAESLRTSSESIGATAVSGACAALAAAAAAEDLGAARSFLPSLLLQCERFTAELSPFGDAGRISAVLTSVG